MREFIAFKGPWVALLGALAAGCREPGGGPSPGGDTSTTTETADTSVSTEWSQGMSEAELLAVLEALGIYLAPGAEKDDIIATLEQQTGCGCFGAQCGVGQCGHECGTCKLAGDQCYSGACINASSCTATMAKPKAENAKLSSNGATLQFRYTAELEGGGLEQIKILANTTVDDPTKPGTRDLRTLDLKACPLCVRAYKGCAGGTCAETFVAVAGELAIDKGVQGGTFSGSGKNLVLKPSYEDPKTGNVYPLGGTSACVNDFAFTAPVEEVVIDPGDCLPDGTGITVGSQIKNFELQNCNGDKVQFHSVCGKKAVWVVAAAGW